uniref:C3H1-type domain-containing protein n=2 Tax=Aegilops tauschii TaxID=37682 RepID=A0A453EPV3_AEGTS
MNRRPELYRNYQHDSCKYEEQCRFVHANSNQQ